MLKKWIFRLAATTAFIIILLIVIICNPILSYGNRATYNDYNIFHKNQIDPALKLRLDEATDLVKTSKFYDSTFKIDICLNDCSLYPALMQKIIGQAFGRGFYNKVILMGNARYKENYVELNGYRWNLTQLLAHEMMHCFEYHKLGFLRSKPIAKIADWRWEGYPEYVARQDSCQKDLSQNITCLLQTEKTNNNGWIQFADNTGTVISYYKSWLRVKYCIDVQGMTATEMLRDTTQAEVMDVQMMEWYRNKEGK